MPFSVECYFDRAAEGAVRGLWTALAAAQINSRMIEVDARPHISLTVAEGEPTLPVGRRLQEFVSARTRFQIQFGSVGVFPNDLGVLFLAPQASSELARLHLDWCAAVSALEIPVWEHYMPGNWTPHCTLAIGLLPDRFADAFGISREVPFPLRAEIREISLVKIGPREVVSVFPLA